MDEWKAKHEAKMEEAMTFEDEFPEAAAILIGLYRGNKRWVCEAGHTHRLPYRLHCGRDFCAKVLHRCWRSS